MFSRSIANVTRFDYLPRCLPCARGEATWQSKGETELGSFIATVTSSPVALRDRKLLGGNELDFYLPVERLAVEYNGDYWHSPRMKSGRSLAYHQDKANQCEKKGVKLAFVWEHDWLNRREEVQKALTEFIETGVLSPILEKKVSRAPHFAPPAIEHGEGFLVGLFAA